MEWLVRRVLFVRMDALRMVFARILPLEDVPVFPVSQALTARYECVLPPVRGLMSQQIVYTLTRSLLNAQTWYTVMKICRVLRLRQRDHCSTL